MCKFHKKNLEFLDELRFFKFTSFEIDSFSLSFSFS